MIDKSWTQERNKFSPKFILGVQSFIEMTKKHLIRNKVDKCRCPCKKCVNGNPPVSVDRVQADLLKHGMATSYTIWSDHGEEDNPTQNQPEPSYVNVHNDETSVSESENAAVVEMLQNTIASRDFDRQAGASAGTQEAGLGMFATLLEKVKEDLYPGCTNFSSLTFLIELMHIKVLNGLSHKSFEMQLQLLKRAFPKNNTIPDSYYAVKKMLRDLGLGYESIHACKYDCALYWNEYKDRDSCPVCNEPRYKINDGKGKKIPHKVLRYFPLIPRLQRLFSSKHTSDDMTWHKDKREETEGVLRHPADAEAWKDFDVRYPDFAAEPRNVRLGLATDGFNPFGNMSNAYSTWPVVLMPYNLPPWKCMKQPFFMMALLIPGPHAPGNDIDVYLRPLIDELKKLWEFGVETYDASTGKHFRMRASVLWTINDFPAYANLSGWSTKGYLACPVCNDDPPSRKLRSKIGYLCHRRFLNPRHAWRKNKLHDGQNENRLAPKENIADGKISGLKSHDCHVLLQRLLPVGICAYLRDDVCTAIIELCNFFHDLCAKTLTVSHLEKLEKDIVLILCKLERIFPPAFFDVMVHLAVHLPREAKLVGPVGYSWMYPIERYLGTLKRFVKNRARPEGSIAEAYNNSECLTFISMHFRETETKFNRKERNDDGLDDGLQRLGKLSIFAHKVRPIGATDIKSLSLEERDQIRWLILNNCEEVQSYIEEHLSKLKEEMNDDKLLQHRQQKEFPDWFKDRMTILRSNKSPEATDELFSLAMGIELRAKSYSACNLNGVRFHTKQREARRITQNSGLVVDGAHANKTIEFYGTICDIIELEYLYNYRVVLFKCDWFDLTPRKKNIKEDFGLTCLNVGCKWYEDDPFVIASQARQVFYLDDHKFGSAWKVVLKMHHRHIWDVPERDDEQELQLPDFYQQSEDATGTMSSVQEDNVESGELHRNDIEPELVDADIVLAPDIDDMDEDVDEEDDTLIDYNDSEVDEEDVVPIDDDSDIE